MELDNLKSIWQEQGQPALQSVSKTDLSEIIKKESKHPIALIKRNVLLELWVMIISYIAMIIFFFQKDDGLYFYNSVFIGVFLLFGLVYYTRKIMLLNKMMVYTDQLYTHLNKHLILLKKYVNFYYVFGVILLPFVYFMTYIIIIYSKGKMVAPEKGFGELLMSEPSLVSFVAIGIVLTIISPFLNKWYVKKLYGDHVKTIENLVKQIND